MFISVNPNYMNEMKDNTENNLSHFNDNYFYDSNYLKRIAEERNLKI